MGVVGPESADAHDPAVNRRLIACQWLVGIAGDGFSHADQRHLEDAVPFEHRALAALSAQHHVVLVYPERAADVPDPFSQDHGTAAGTTHAIQYALDECSGVSVAPKPFLEVFLHYRGLDFKFGNRSVAPFVADSAEVRNDVVPRQCQDHGKDECAYR